MTFNVAQGSAPGGIDLLVSGNITETGGGGTYHGGIAKSGLGTLVLSGGANTYDGGTFVNGGVLKLAGSSGVLPSTSALTFNGPGTFLYDNTGSSAMSQSLSTLTFSSGEDTVQAVKGGATTSTLTFSNLARTSGAVGYFVSGGSTDTGNKIVLSAGTANVATQGIFFGSGGTASYAIYDPSGYVRAINYNGDSGGIDDGRHDERPHDGLRPGHRPDHRPGRRPRSRTSTWWAAAT